MSKTESLPQGRYSPVERKSIKERTAQIIILQTDIIAMKEKVYCSGERIKGESLNS